MPNSINKKLNICFILFFIFLFISIITKAQVYNGLVKDECKDSINCRIQFSISDKSFSNIRNSRGSKLSFSDIQMNYNGLDIPIKSLNIRGKTTLFYPKKSFNVKLKKKLGIQCSHDTAVVKDFYLLGLSMDRNYINNYTSYSLLKALNIFNLKFSYCEVLINNVTQGIYLFIERPDDYALKTLKSPVLIRRGFNMEIDKIELNKENQAESYRYFRKKFTHMYSLCNKFSGSELYDSLNSYIDLSQYMKWLGFNYIIRNGDYTDELYLYFNTHENRFGIIPWDYDDLFAVHPHEGRDARNAVNGGQFIFSSEDRLDRAIITDEYLYKMYLKELLVVGDLLNENVLTEIFQKTYCSVYPYYLDNNIMETTRLDKYGLTNKDDLFNNLQEKLRSFLTIRLLIKQQVNTNFR